MSVPTNLIAKRQRVVRNALLNEWDPIGIRDVAEAGDEYDAYAPAVYNLVVSDKSGDEILDYLWWLETEQIGMPGDREGTVRFANRLLELRADFTDAR